MDTLNNGVVRGVVYQKLLFGTDANATPMTGCGGESVAKILQRAIWMTVQLFLQAEVLEEVW